MRWSEFADACPEIAVPARERFVRDELVLLGTVTRDGWPRISPCELDFVGDDLQMGMMWRSPKALDLLRGSPLLVHSVQADRHAVEPDIKLRGRGIDLSDPAVRDGYRAAIKARIDWEPEEPNYHLFALEVEQAAVLSFGKNGETITTWDPQTGLLLRRKSGG